MKLPTQNANTKQEKYLDITDEFLENAKNNSCGYVIDAAYFQTMDNKKFYIDGKHIKLSYTKYEKDFAIWLVKKFGGFIYMLPKVNYPNDIKTPDYLWNNEYWELKTISEYAISQKRAVDNIIKNAKGQANNIILDITRTGLSKENIIEQTKKLYSTNKREWINKVIIVDSFKLIKVFYRK